MVLDNNWFTEACEDIGTAFSLRLGEKLHDEQSQYQRIEVYATRDFGNLMVIDGYIMLTARDNFVYHEMMTHPALFAHGAAKDVVIIGGGDCGTLREVCKHQSVEQVTQIEIDERVTRVAEEYFPELCSANNDPRASLAFDDGIAWMQAAPDESLDLIIVDSTDPIGPAEGLFNKAFYKQCRRALRPGGLFVQQSESPLAHTPLIVSMHSAMQESGFAASHVLSFPQPVYPTGWWSASLAQRDAGELRCPQNTEGLNLLYYTPQMHTAAFAQPAFLQKQLAAKLKS